MPEHRLPAFDSIVELELYVADSVDTDPALVKLGEVAGAIYQGAIGGIREELNANGPDALIDILNRYGFDPDEVWASEASDGDELYSVTQYLLIVLVKTPDTKNKAGETYWECVGEINSFKWADCLKESHL